MPRTSAKFQQADVARVLRAVEQTGAQMEVVLELDGRIRLTRAINAPVKVYSDSVSIPRDADEIEL